MSPKKAPRKLSRDILLAFGIPVIFIPGLLLASLLGWDWRLGLAALDKNPDKYFASEQIFPKKGKVERVIDGDTFVLYSGEKVRLMGIDAPELAAEWGMEARAKVVELTSKQEITLEYEEKEKLDAYGRLLAYVWVNKELLNALLLEEGYAKTLLYKHETPPKYWLLFQNKEAFAKERHYGLWYRSY